MTDWPRTPSRRQAAAHQGPLGVESSRWREPPGDGRRPAKSGSSTYALAFLLAVARYPQNRGQEDPRIKPVEPSRFGSPSPHYVLFRPAYRGRAIKAYAFFALSRSQDQVLATWKRNRIMERTALFEEFIEDAQKYLRGCQAELESEYRLGH